MKLASIVPWGRCFAEYRDMFALSDADMRGRILGCGDGPASFNAEATALGARVVSVDPVYAFGGDEIEARVRETFPALIGQARDHAERFVWTRFADADALADARMGAMRAFLADYAAGKEEGRYLEAALPKLPFADQSFDLALVSHLLFLYSEHLSEAAHVAGVRELLRVAREVRIFPLLMLEGVRSAYVEAVAAAARGAGCYVEETPVPYEFQRGATHMLRIWQAA